MDGDFGTRVRKSSAPLSPVDLYYLMKCTRRALELYDNFCSLLDIWWIMPIIGLQRAN